MEQAEHAELVEQAGTRGTEELVEKSELRVEGEGDGMRARVRVMVCGAGLRVRV